MTAASRSGVVFVLLGRRENLCAPQRGGVLLLLEEERNGCAPQRSGVFSPLERGGERLRPTFLFLSREKKKRAAPGTKKKSAWSGFREESCSFFVCVYVLTVGILVLCGLVLPLAPLPLSHTHVIIRKNMYYLDYLTIQQCSLCWFCKLKQVVSIQKLVHHEYLTHSCCKLVANSLTILRLLFEKNQNPRAIPEFVDTFYHL